MVALDGKVTTAHKAAFRVRSKLSGGLQDEVVLVTEALNAAGTLLKITSNTGMAVGTILEAPEGEQMYVTAVSSQNEAVTVVRGFNDTVAEALAVDDQIRVNPYWPLVEIEQALREEISSLGSHGLFKFHTEDVVVDDEHYVAVVFNTDEFYNTPIEIVDARVLPRYVGDRVRSVTATMHPPIDLDERGTEVLVSFPYTKPNYGYTVRLTFAFEFDPVSDDSDLLLGFQGERSTGDFVRETYEYIQPALILGAAYRLILSKESRRLNLQVSKDSRPNDAVDPRAISLLSRAMEAEYYQALDRAAQAQIKRHPPRMM